MTILCSRAVPLSGRQPQSLDEKGRSVEVVIATEAPVEVWDWSRWEAVREVLLMSGLEQPVAQVPLLDTHNRESTSNVLGSVRDITVQGDRLVARAYFSEAPEAATAFQKVKEGHLTDLSVGYRVTASVWVEEGTTAEVNGRRFEGPMRVVTGWQLREVSLCPIGADQQAKVRNGRAGRPTKEETMDPRLRKFLEERGLAPEASEEEAWHFLERLELRRDQESDPPDPGRSAEPAAGDEPPEPPVPDPEEVARQERERILEIRAMCRELHLGEELAEELIRSGQPLEVCQARALEELRRRNRTADGTGYRPPEVRLGRDERDKFRHAASHSVLLRAGLPVEGPAEGADELRGLTLRELAGECLRRAGQRVPSDPRERIGRALTDSDLPSILGDIANKSVMLGWDSVQETWPLWCGTGSVADFKPNRVVRLSEADDLLQIRQDDEYRYGNFTDAQEEFRIHTYGRMFVISREALINDDLNVLTSIPMALGEAAKRTVGDVAWAALTANAAMGDGKPLFHADHNNLKTGINFDLDGLGEMIKALTSQKDLKGKRRINIPPTFLLAPRALWLIAEKFFGSEFIGTQGEPNVRNPLAGTFGKEQRIYEPRLDDDDTKAFYIVGPKGRLVKVFFLNGVQRPYLETREGWTRDGREYKVRIDCGAAAMDWRAGVKGVLA
jgi:HK97 family phage prohead protease